jgi:AraC family transcriptional regulator
MTSPDRENRPTMQVEASLHGEGLAVEVARFDIPTPTGATIFEEHAYYINMCLTPRPLEARGCYTDRWGPHRFERLGDIFLVPPGERMVARGGSGRQGSVIAKVNSERLTTLLGRELEWTDQPLARTLDIASGRIRHLLFRLTEEAHHPGLASGRMADFLGGELAIEVGRYCLEVHEMVTTGGLSSWRLREIDERLGDDLSAPTLAELADLCGLSVRQLTRGFKVSRGCSIGDYVEQRRMESAKRLLMTGQSVKEIAFALGFASPSSFTFAFRRSVGISPSQFRQRQLRPILGADAFMA